MNHGGPGRGANNQARQWLAPRCGRLSPFEPKREFSALPAPLIGPTTGSLPITRPRQFGKRK
jgi:hypothetical protein